MELVKVGKTDDALTIPLPAALVEALRLAEDDMLEIQQVGEEIVLRRAAATQERPAFAGRYPTAAELLKLPLEERDRILAAAAAEAEEEYRTNRELTDFEAFGEGDLYDDYPD